jgi:PAS domain-containing protein
LPQDREQSSAFMGDDNHRGLALESSATPNLTDQLLDLLPAAVYVCAPDGMILRFNRRAAELWGREPLLGDQKRSLLRLLSHVPTRRRSASA